jgi:hypothetical protein
VAGDKEIDNNNPATNRADGGKFAFNMTRLIVGNVNDPSEREWMQPSFTTTTKVD